MEESPPAALRVHVYGPGPRARGVAAALVREALPQAAVALYADETAAAAAAGALRTILLDARVAPEPAALARFAAQHASAYALARGFDGSRRTLSAARIVDAAQRPGSAPPLEIGGWYDDPELGLAPARGRSVEVHAQGLGHGGYASGARNTLVGLRRAGVDAVWQQIYPESELVAIDPHDRELLTAIARPERIDCSLAISPPTHLTGQLFLDRYLEAYASPPYVVYTMFETDAVPARWPRMLANAAKTWVPSRFNVETFAGAGLPRDLIEYVPLGLEVEHLPLDGAALEVAGRRRFAFLSVFGFSLRKGWDVLVRAWAQAFGRDDEVCLILRTSGGEVDVRSSIERELRAAGLDPALMAPVIVLEKPLSASDLAALYRSADAFVLPSRGEGVGLPYLEAMAFGLPVIGTDWSGSTEFLTARTGYPIASQPHLVERETWRSYPVLRAQQWAAPSIAATAEQLRAVYADREEAARRAARGCALARLEYNRTRTGHLAAAALERIEPRPRRARSSRAAIRFSAPFFSIDGGGASARSLLGALERTGIPVAAEAYGVDQRGALFLDDARVLRAALERGCAADAPTIVQAGEALQGRSIGGRPLLLPEAIDVERWTPQLGGLSGLGAETSVRFLTTARLNEHSGYDRAIGAFLLAFEPGEDVMLAIKVPDGPLDPAQAQALVVEAAARHAPRRSAALGGYRISILAGVVPEGDYMQLVGSFDAFIALAQGAGWSRALLEAMAASLACVCDRGAAQRGLCDERSVFLTAASDLAHTASLLRAIAEQTEAAAARGAAARRRVVERHAYSVVGSLAHAALDGIPLEPTQPTGAPADELFVILDARFGGDAPHALAALHGSTIAPRRIAVAADDAAFAGACAQANASPLVAYLSAKTRVTAGWDVMLRDALRSRPLVTLAVPRITGAPGPQGVAPPERLAPFARELSITQMGRGGLVAAVVSSALLFEGAAFARAAAQAASIDAIVRLCGAQGRTWCCHDVVVGWEAPLPPSLIDLTGV